MLITAELTATLLLFQAIQHRRIGWLPLAGVVAAASVWIHFTAVFLLPVWAFFLIALVLVNPQKYRRTCLWAGLLALVPFVVAAAVGYRAVHALQASGALGDAADFQRVVPLLVRFAFYVGAPTCLLAVVGACVSGVRQEGRLLLVALATVPLAATVLIAVLRLANVSMHHGILAVVGLAGLAGVAMDTCCGNQPKWLCRTIGGVTAGYYAAGLILYLTVMHGDRPRWKEAAEALTSAVANQKGHTDGVPIYSTEPFALAYYLGVPAGELFHQSRVLPFTWNEVPPRRPAWLVVDNVELLDAAMPWLAEDATRVASFAAHTGPQDRTVTVLRIE
jgi:hypothetical protein